MIIETENNVGMFLIHIVNRKVVVHAMLVEKQIKVDIYSFEKKDFILKDEIMEHSNYFMVDNKLRRGKYKITVEADHEIIEKTLTI